MNHEKKNAHGRFGLTALFSAIVFLILLITSVLIFFIGVLMIRTNELNLAKLSRQEPLVPIMVLLVISVVVGTVVSFMISRVPLKPLRRVIDAINRLAAGDFSPRLHFSGSNSFTELSTSFNRMAEELGSIEMLRSDFVDSFSHEFKTPIVSIKGFAEELSTTTSRRNSGRNISTSSSTNPRAWRSSRLTCSISPAWRSRRFSPPARSLTSRSRCAAVSFYSKANGSSAGLSSRSSSTR